MFCNVCCEEIGFKKIIIENYVKLLKYVFGKECFEKKEVRERDIVKSLEEYDN